MTTIEVLDDLLVDLRLRDKSLEEIRVDYCMKNNQKEASRLVEKLSGFRLALGLVELRRNDAVRDATEVAKDTEPHGRLCGCGRAFSHRGMCAVRQASYLERTGQKYSPRRSAEAKQ